jgi:SOUL heme-binding protein
MSRTNSFKSASFRHSSLAVLQLTALAWLGSAQAQSNVDAGTAVPPAAQRSLPSDSYEQPRYTVVKQLGELEIRDYAPMLLAEVTLTGTRDQTLSDGFRVLARYIFGNNTQRSSIAMTSPVTQSPSPAPSEKIAMTSPVVQSPQAASVTGDSVQSYTVAFMLPRKYTLATLPVPQDERIKFRVTEPERRAVLRFSGLSGESVREEKQAQLMAFVAANGLKPLAAAQWAQYDDPFTLPWNRRNEWWVAVQ